MKLANIRLLAPAVVLLVTALLMTTAAPLASAQASHVRWDIASVPCTGTPATSGFPCTLNPGGSATAMAVDCSIPGTPFGCSTITLTGTGTFLVSASGGTSSAVTGGGTWKVVAGDGTTTSGTYLVKELIQWQKSEPLAVVDCGTCMTGDNIGSILQAWGGLAVFRVGFSDGTEGVLTLACAGLPDPVAVTEGMIVSKGVQLNNIAIPGINVPPLPPNFLVSKRLLPVLFWNPGVFQSFAEFHVQDPSN